MMAMTTNGAAEFQICKKMSNRDNAFGRRRVCVRVRVRVLPIQNDK